MPTRSPACSAVASPTTTGSASPVARATGGAKSPATSSTCCSKSERKRRFDLGRSASSLTGAPGTVGKWVALLAELTWPPEAAPSAAATALSPRVRERW